MVERKVHCGLRLPLVLATLAMGVGCWLKWRYLLVPDPRSWYLYSWGQLAYTDLVALYLQQNLEAHPIPYLETWLEYPVVVGAVQYLASLVEGAEGYFLASSLLLGLSGLGTAWAIHAMDRSARLWIFVATPPLLLYAALNWDLLALFFAVLSLYLFQRRRDGWSALFLGLGIWTKLFPVVLLPWMVFHRTAERSWGRLGVIGGVMVATSAALNLPVYLANPDGWRYFLDFQTRRSPDGGSLWSYFPEWSVQAVNQTSLVVVVVGVAALGIAGTRGGGRVAEFAVGALALVFLFSKVSSPQYDLWLMPFMALAPPPAWLVALFVGVDLAYFWSSFQTLYLEWGGQSEYMALHADIAGPINVARQGSLLLIYLWATWRALSRLWSRNPNRSNPRATPPGA